VSHPVQYCLRAGSWLCWPLAAVSPVTATAKPASAAHYPARQQLHVGSSRKGRLPCACLECCQQLRPHLWLLFSPALPVCCLLHRHFAGGCSSRVVGGACSRVAVADHSACHAMASTAACTPFTCCTCTQCASSLAVLCRYGGIHACIGGLCRPGQAAMPWSGAASGSCCWLHGNCNKTYVVVVRAGYGHGLHNMAFCRPGQ
jgi:hypothetical protein